MRPLQPSAKASGGVPVECVAVQQAATGIKTFEFRAPKGLRYQPGMYVSFDLQVGLVSQSQSMLSPLWWQGRVRHKPCTTDPAPDIHATRTELAQAFPFARQSKLGTGVSGTTGVYLLFGLLWQGLEGDGVITNRTWTVSSHPDETAAR